MKKKLALKNHFLETDLFRNRTIAGAVFIGIFALVLIARLLYLQVMEHRLYSTLSRQNLLSVIPIEPNRGLIYDRNGVLLAKNIPTYTLAIIPSRVKDLNATFEALKKVVDLSQDDIDEFNHVRFQYRTFQPVPLKFKLSEQEVDQFYVNQFRFPGVFIETRMMRYYPLGAATSDVVGYVGRINPHELNNLGTDNYTASADIGKIGIEKYYEALLRGKLGAEEAEINARGHIVRILKEVPPVPGQNIYLTIDSNLQQVAEQALGGNSGAVVAIQPDTGEVLALVSQPSYDPNPFVSGLSQQDYEKLLNAPQHPLYNRALRGQFASGSTIKPFYALFGLDDGVITPNYSIYDPGYFKLPGTDHIFHDWKDGGHGWVNVSTAIMVSCDTFFYNLSVFLGIDRIDNILHAFGFGEPTGIDLPNGLNGLVPTPNWKMGKTGHPWYTGDTVETGIGQGFFLVTPLQLADATATLANRGLRFTPQLLLKSIDPQGETTIQMPEALPPVVLQHPDVWNIVINAMQGVVTNSIGTAEFFGRKPPFTVAAKTGTAQVYGHSRDEDHSRTNVPENLRNNHLFIAFAPVDHPQIALAIVVEHSADADHMARLIMDYYFKHPASDLTATFNSPINKVAIDASTH